DRVHVVSPGYASEILEPSIPSQGLVRGEGLESDLRRIAAQGRLHGILNGCDYPARQQSGRKPAKARFIEAAVEALQGWVGDRSLCDAAHFHALLRLQEWGHRKGREA